MTKTKLRIPLSRFLMCIMLAAWPLGSSAETVRLGAATPATTLGHPFVLHIGGGVKSSVYDSLTQITKDRDLQPALATAWELVDSTTWRFQLREDVTFHNGKAFNADTVSRIFEFLRSDEAKALTAAQDMKNVVAAHAVAPFTVEFKTRVPDPIFDRRLSMISIVEPDAWRDMGPDEYASNPIGTGPYRLIDWGPVASNIILEAYDDAWRQPVDVDRIEMVMIPDAVTREQALLSGAIDITINLDPDSRDIVEAAGINTVRRTSPIVLAIALRNVNNPGSPLLDRRVRQALNYAVDKQTMRTLLLNNLMEVASQEVTPAVEGYNPDIAPFTYDPDRARALLRDAGYPDGFKLTIAIFSGQVPADTLIFQKTSQDLGAIGIDVELRRLPYAEFSRRIISGQWDDIGAFSTVWSSIQLRDAATAIDRLSCDYLIPTFCAERLMPQVEAARQEMDKDARRKQLQAILAEFHEEAPSILLFEYAEFVALHPKITRYVTRSDGIMFDQIEIAP